MGSLQTRDQTTVSCIVRYTVNHQTTREALKVLLKNKRNRAHQRQGHPPGVGLDQGEPLVKVLQVARMYWSPEDQGLGWEE